MKKVDIQKTGTGKTYMSIYQDGEASNNTLIAPGPCELRVDKGNPNMMVICPLSDNSSMQEQQITFDQVVTNLGAGDIKTYLIALADGEYFTK